MRARHGYWIALIAWVVMLVGPVGAASAEVTDERIDAGIKQLRAGLFSLQNAQGHWDPETPGDGKHTYGAQYGGTTALVTYALLSSGVSYQDPRVAKAIDWLSELEMKGVYAVALRIHVWAALPEKFMPKLKEDMYWLIEALHEVNTGGHAFSYTPELKDWSNSRTQYGLLGLWEGAKRGYPVSQEAWASLEKHFVNTQTPEGSWPYDNSKQPQSSTMTCVGVTCLYILQDYLHSDDYRKPGNARQHPVQQMIDKGLGYMGKHYQPDRDVEGRGTQFAGYYLYGVERVGLASGEKYFNGKDWFASGAEHILSKIKADGTIKISSQGFTSEATDGAFTLLFLTRGSRPILMNKLRIDGYDWANRPRDVANLASWLSDEMEGAVNWQVVDLETNPDDWLDAPILYLASHEPLQLSDEQEQKLKRYIDLGGLLVTVADGNSIGFTKSVKDLMSKLYPRQPYTAMPNDDPLLHTVHQLTNTLGVESMHNGVRHLAIHLPRGDVSWALHARQHSNPHLWRFFTNLYYYATEGRPRTRVAGRDTGDKADGGVPVTVLRAKYDGNWNPEPLAWPVQAKRMRGKASVTLTDADLTSIADADADLVHVVGADAREFSDAEVAAIKAFVEKGGVILFENVGGNGTFGESAMIMANSAFPDQRLRPVSIASDLVTGASFGGYDVSDATYRPYVVQRLGAVTGPRLMAVHVDDQPRLIICTDDLSAGMLGQRTWGVYGYSGPSAQRLITNVALYAAQLRRNR